MVAPWLPPAKKAPVTPDVALINALGSLAEKQTGKATELLAVHVSGYSQASESWQKERAQLQGELKEQRTEITKLHEDLQKERAKHDERDIALEKVKAEAKAAKDRLDELVKFGDKALGFGRLALVNYMGGKKGDVAALTSGAAAKPAGDGATAVPEAETVLDGILRDLKGTTFALAYPLIRPALLPLLVRKDFMLSLYSVLGSPEGAALAAAIREDLSPDGGTRIDALIRAIGA